jgi:GntR family transcriptional repressor for pyruvate dehydrogenase complex
MELGKQFNVSRTSVREAVQILSARGLVTVEKGRGIYVNKITSNSVIDPLKNFLKLELDEDSAMDLTHARQVLEPAIASEAAKNRNEEDLRILNDDIEALEKCKGSFEELAALDMQFHLDLAKATHNIIIPLLIQPIHSLLPRIKPYVYANVDDSKDSALVWHKKILNAIVNQDQETAYQEMIEHLKIAELHARKVLKLESA